MLSVLEKHENANPTDLCIEELTALALRIRKGEYIKNFVCKPNVDAIIIAGEIEERVRELTGTSVEALTNTYSLDFCTLCNRLVDSMGCKYGCALDGLEADQLQGKVVRRYYRSVTVLLREEQL
jgi:hypothetical protein